MRRAALCTLAAFAAFVLHATAAQAQPRLMSAHPAAKATVSRPSEIRLGFSEALAAPLTGLDLTMTGMPGMANHAPMPIRGFTPVVKGNELIVTLPRPLPAGTYALKWHAAGTDQQQAEGAYTFTVR